MAGDYIKCPRCELNYIHKDQKYCDVCKAELKMGPKLIFANDDELDDYEDMELCPICKQNYIKMDEEMCDKCREEMEFKKDELDIDRDEEWRTYLDDDKEMTPEESEEMMSLNQLAEEEEEELEDDEYTDSYDDDFKDEDLDDIDDEDFDESDEDEEEDEDEEDE